MENFLQWCLSVFIVLNIIASCNSEQTKKGANQGQSEQPVSNDDPSSPSGEGTKQVNLKEGEKVYRRNCLTCHQSNGSGVPGMYPPIRNTSWVQGDKDKLISIVTHGMKGEIEVHGEVYNNIMPGNPNLSDESVANVLSYIRRNFGNDAGPVYPDEVKKIRQKAGEVIR